MVGLESNLQGGGIDEELELYQPFQSKNCCHFNEAMRMKVFKLTSTALMLQRVPVKSFIPYEKFHYSHENEPQDIKPLYKGIL